MLSGRTALLSGSVGGIGYATAAALAAQGCNVMLNGFGDADEIEERRAALEAEHGVRALHHNADLRNIPEIEDLVSTTERELGPVDIVVNNAVVRHFAPIEDFDPDNWQESLDVNLSASFHLIRLTLRGMKQRGWGRVINLASTLGMIAMPNRVDYVVTKTALMGMARAIALETQQDPDITVNAICPGAVRTPAAEKRVAAFAETEGIAIEEATRTFLQGRQPTGRFIEPSQVGALIAFLCSDAAREITGASIPIDDGWTISP
ncbi:MAG: SDR family oxidoreductase [Pseudomonadota bacterium]